ncbi:hypothetical protein R7X75_03315, partial [Mesomycoplasma ovipneumoniae]|uniref:hypothetical protein n=1 Tax=Mesomycoplasma ovipneumoniae TaxID=29562 RepID=UPI0029650111
CLKPDAFLKLPYETGKLGMGVRFKICVFALIVIYPDFAKKIKKVPSFGTFLRLSHQIGKLGNNL